MEYESHVCMRLWVKELCCVMCVSTLGEATYVRYIQTAVG